MSPNRRDKCFAAFYRPSWKSVICIDRLKLSSGIMLSVQWTKAPSEKVAP